MKSSNKVSIQKAFIQQATDFESGRMNFSSKDKLCRISDQTAADGCGVGGCRRNLRLRTCACTAGRERGLSGYDARDALGRKGRG